MSEHTHKQFDAEMEAIRTGVLAMGGLVETQLARAIDVLEDGDDRGLLDQSAPTSRRSTRCRSTSTSSAARSSPSGSRRRSTCG